MARIVVYLTIEKEYFNLKELHGKLKKQRINMEVEQLKKTLERLMLAFILPKKGNKYHYHIPIFKEIVIRDDVAFLLENEVLNYR